MATSMGIRTCVRSLVLPRLCAPSLNQISNQRLCWVSTETRTDADTSSTVSDTEKGNDQKQAVQPSDVEIKLKEETEKLDKKVKELTDKYRRALAETENVRARFKKQLDDSRLYSIQGFCKDLLEVGDILGAATTSVPKEELEGSSVNPHLKSLYQGLQMTEAQLQKVFSKNHLSQINPVDEKFDPNFHEALFETVMEGKDPGTVAIVTKIGYKLHNRTIRPALVGVTKTP